MEKEIIDVLVREIARLRAWKDSAQQMSFAKDTYHYEKELHEEIQAIRDRELNN